jgi:hypothetical protein
MTMLDLEPHNILHVDAHGYVMVCAESRETLVHALNELGASFGADGFNKLCVRSCTG